MITQFKPYSIARLPAIEFGSGKFDLLADCAARYGQHALIVTGAKSFLTTEHWQRLQKELENHKIQHHIINVTDEPSPELVDAAVERHRDDNIDVVLGIGGGSALDAAKAIAGLLRVRRSVMDYLEGVGAELPYEGPAVPLIAVPTTAGTGSEATKNAVLSKHGLDGFKKSFRDEQLVAEVAIVDPDLLASCPQSVIAANGMDALTQLIESYVSTRSNVFCDALGISGMRAARDGLIPLYESNGSDSEARERMAYASMISGINLAQTGLGSVHGLASPLGAFYPIPHGVVCGTLVATATEMNIKTMLAREPENPALDRYARISEVLCQKRHRDKETAWQALINLLDEWTETMQLQRLSEYGLEETGLDHVVDNAFGSSMKTNPIVLEKSEVRSIIEKRM
jgi:alcohol dehydrogenase